MEQAFLEITSPQGAQKLPIGADPVTIGRQIANSVVLDDSEASRFHCVVERTAGGFRVRDLGSRNGTKVNGVGVKERPLADGDQLMVGTTTLRYEGP